jgi:putative restriction endonuclease
MDSEKIIEILKHLSVFQRDGKRAPHKPLLLLFALGRMLNRNQRLISFSEIESEFKNILATFSPWSRAYRPEFPFWRLQSDGLWSVENKQDFTLNSSGDPLKSDLVKMNPAAGFKTEIYETIKTDRVLLKTTVETILKTYFPSTIHEDILQAVGLDANIGNYSTRQERDINFRDKILKAYEYKCSICGFDVRLGNQPIALEAAHIKWVQAGGPCVEENGVALCAMHHKLFDRGAFSISTEMKIMVSDEANGSLGFNEWLMSFHRKDIRRPQRTASYPKEEFISWHIREVFRGEYRN